MQLSEFDIQPLHIPFKFSFQHSEASRSVTETLIVKTKTRKGIQGIGEGCPRHYVTGENIESAMTFLGENRNNFLKIGSLTDLECWISENTRAIDQNPAAFCAMELALLDTLAKTQNVSVERLVSLPDLTGQFHYSAVLGTENSKYFHAFLNRYLQMQMKDFKVKLFGDSGIDSQNLSAIKACNRTGVRVRLDANNLWGDSTIALDYLNELNFPCFALEEPLTKNDYLGMRQISRELDIPVILDESFTRLQQFDLVGADPKTWILNIRISKMGGILRAIKVADKARNLGIPLIIGAQVGETSVLTRAALTVANSFRDILIAQEGAFGTFLLERDIVNPAIMFGNAGVLDAACL